ncbi:MAG: DUF262 domain-containing protein [Gammaproteobacteria bacterium]|nr:DUF262 domain-containing protein [Gammaproteobacteria bacterium]
MSNEVPANHDNASTVEDDVEGLDSAVGSWGDYPIDELLIRHDHRTVYDVLRRIERNSYVMNPDFQRDFIWPEDKQSKLIESVIMRIPLPVFYMAEDEQGRAIVVDGLQRLSTFRNYVGDGFRLRLPDRPELNGHRFSELSTKFQNRVEDCNLIFYIIDAKAPPRARLDIFERVNGGEPLTRQQMRNCLFMGNATRFLKDEATSDLFLDVTGDSLNWRTMRDREFVNRFCAFSVLGVDQYRGDMDDFLAATLTQMNKMPEDEMDELSERFRRSLANNRLLFDRHCFRKSLVQLEGRRSVINASLWDVMSTGLSGHSEESVTASAEELRWAMSELLQDEDFTISITYATNDRERVRHRFAQSTEVLEEILGVPEN